MAADQTTPASRDATGGVGARDVLMTGLGATLARWRSWSLARQFATSATLVLLPAMLTIGWWVSSRIQEAVTHGAATSAALYMENFVEPLVQELAKGDVISEVNQQKLARLLTDTSLGQKVISFKIWTMGNIIVASNRPELIGKSFEPSPSLRESWKGKFKAEFDHLVDQENEFERKLGVPLLELYIPLRARGGEKVIAVGEFYEKAYELSDELRHAKFNSWLVVAGVTLAMLSALFGIVWRGSQTIEDQRRTLEERVKELTRLLQENGQLRARARRASARASESNEVFLRRLGADLHDGPAQLISLALLRLDERPRTPTATTDAAAGVEPTTSRDGKVRTVLVEALDDLRNLAAGFAVPEIDQLSIEQTIRQAARRHEQLTASAVQVTLGTLPGSVPPALKLCAYRTVQEGLTNGFRHAGGKDQSVLASSDDETLRIEVADSGPGYNPKATNESASLGLRGLTDRIESLSGSLEIVSRSGEGTRLIARLPLELS